MGVFRNGDFRVTNCPICCHRWYFTFNGAECSTPSAIDGIFFVWKNINYARNPHRPEHIEGICEKLRKGTVRVGFWVGKCVGTRYKSGDAATGFHYNVPDLRGRSVSSTGLKEKLFVVPFFFIVLNFAKLLMD